MSSLEKSNLFDILVRIASVEEHCRHARAAIDDRAEAVGHLLSALEQLTLATGEFAGSSDVRQDMDAIVSILQRDEIDDVGRVSSVGGA